VEALEHKLTIGPHGTVHAGIKAREVVASATSRATWKPPKDRDSQGGQAGRRYPHRPHYHRGRAYFKGSIDIVKPEPAKPPARPAAAPRTPRAGRRPSPAALPFGAPEVKR